MFSSDTLPTSIRKIPAIIVCNTDPFDPRGEHWICIYVDSINESLLNKLQHIQNAAARDVTDTRKYDNITPVLQDLHWLPIRQRIPFKLATMVYKCQRGLCPAYLAEDCILLFATRGRQHRRSTGRLELLVPRTRTVTFGPRAFTVAGQGVWNSLPPALREPTLSFNCFGGD